MKTLVLIRHAKSSWKGEGLTDFERPLNERGLRDAPEMAVRLKARDFKIDGFISSPAIRAKKTAKLFMEVLNGNDNELLLVPELYDASLLSFKKVVENISDTLDTVAMFAHNPAITDYVNSLGTTPVHDMPTCAVYAVEINGESWIDIQVVEKEFLFFDYPKNSE